MSCLHVFVVVLNTVLQFVNHPQISAILDEEEEECLHYLTKVRSNYYNIFFNVDRITSLITCFLVASF